MLIIGWEPWKLFRIPVVGRMPHRLVLAIIASTEKDFPSHNTRSETLIEICLSLKTAGIFLLGGIRRLQPLPEPNISYVFYGYTFGVAVLQRGDRLLFLSYQFQVNNDRLEYHMLSNMAEYGISHIMQSEYKPSADYVTRVLGFDSWCSAGDFYFHGPLKRGNIFRICLQSLSFITICLFTE